MDKSDLCAEHDFKHSRMFLFSLCCRRKNVGGIMSEDLFAYSNTGEPKYIVKEFIEEVVTSLHWLSNEASKVPLDDLAEYVAAEELSNGVSTTHSVIPQTEQKQMYEEKLQQTVRKEKEKLWKSLITATLTLFVDGKENPNGDISLASSFDEIRDVADKVNNPPSLSIYHRLEVLAFLKRARAAYGRTALCLSGGAMMGKQSIWMEITIVAPYLTNDHDISCRPIPFRSCFGIVGSGCSARYYQWYKRWQRYCGGYMHEN